MKTRWYLHAMETHEGKKRPVYIECFDKLELGVLVQRRLAMRGLITGLSSTPIPGGLKLLEGAARVIH